jgi:3-hydroxyisobutyryl-CoA hydrolase
MGGGFGISAFAPFRIATENSMFAMPEGKLGFFTDVGSTYILSRMRNSIGYYLGLTGSRLKGEDVYISGLANYYLNR